MPVIHMEDKTKESLIQELYKSAVGTEYKRDNGESRFVARTNTLSGNPVELDESEEAREKRTEITLQKDEYYAISSHKCRCAVVKGDLHLGDTLVIRELNGFNQTGMFLVQKITHVLRGTGIKEGYCIACWE